MKRILFLLLLFISACSHFKSKQEIAEGVVKKWLDSALNDPHSYESVKFDTLKPFYATYEMGDPVGKKMDTLAASYIDSSAKYNPESMDNMISEGKNKANSHLSEIYKKKEDSIENIIKQRDKTYKGAILNYSIIHTYRAKNGFGALAVHTSRFQIDSALTKVTFAEEINN